MFNRRIFITTALFLTASCFICAQEALKSTEEEYYDFLALDGLVERPALNYRTLSDSVWNLSGDEEQSDVNIWKNNNLGSIKNITDHVSYKIYGPDWFNSYNTAEPYGQNDGALWQGKGYNTSFTAGARIEAYGFEITLKPLLCFSQNLKFDYITPNSAYTGNNSYSGKAGTYGYYGVPYEDAPQRFGDKAFFTYDWGDTEVRYTWKTLTIGFGTQSIWLGPAEINPIIHSNNAPTYPKLDLGIRRQSIHMPWTHWYLGDIEARGWWGYLSESDYFDNDSSNDHNLIAGFAAAWAPPYLTGFSIGVNRTMLSKWDEMNTYNLFKIYNPFMSTGSGSDKSDQRFSLTLDYLCTKAGLETYLEWARNDFSPSYEYILRYPFHTQGWTLGGKKSIKFSNTLRGELLIEATDLESSRDYEKIAFGTDSPTTFYSHGIISQGYTNGGQWLGAGIGTGGNSQYIGFKLYYPRGYFDLFFQRVNPDLDYTWYYDEKTNSKAQESIKVTLNYGTGALFYFTPSFSIMSYFVFTDDKNPLNDCNSSICTKRYNVHINFTLKYLM